MCYHGYNGVKYPENSEEGDGFKAGDVVEVDVDRSTSTVKYFANGTIKAIHTHPILTDASRVLMPYFETWNTNDAVEWLI